MKIKTLTNSFKDKDAFFFALVLGLNWLFPDKLYCKLLYRIRIGRRLNLKNPVSYNEKLQWLKLYYRKPEYTDLVDKYEVKKHIERLIGKEYVIPTLGVWDRVEDIEWDALPNQFVLKTTHGSGSTGVVVCTDKGSFDKEMAVKRLKQSMEYDVYKRLREWPYKNIKKRIIAEQYITDGSGDGLRDYKFYCFDGVPKIMLLITERELGGNAMCDYYDMDFNHLPFTWAYPNSNNPVTVPPENFDKMKELASVLSRGIPQVRVDLYNVGGHIYFGELTFYHGSGLCKFDPYEWDVKMGNWITLPENKIISK